MSPATAEQIPHYTPGTWPINPARSRVRFSVLHLGLHRVHGSLTVAGDITVAEDPRNSTVSAAVDLTSVDTGSKGRDKAIRSASLFDVAHHPTATYHSTQVIADSDAADNPGAFLLHGELALLGVRHDVPLQIKVGFASTPHLRQVTVSGRGQFNRHDFGLRYHVRPAFLDRAIGTTVQIEVWLQSTIEMESR